MGKKIHKARDENRQIVRIILISKKVRSLEKICQEIILRGKEKNLIIKGPVRIPVKKLHITTRKSPCGEGTNTWDKFEINIHKRIIDITSDNTDVIRQIPSINIEPGVEIEVNIL
jgi:small subunit ribosomal protein S20e